MLFCEQSKWRNWIIILLKKRIPSRYLKILSQCTVKKTKNDWQRFETFCLRESKSFNKLYDNKHTYTWLSWQVAFCSVFFFFKDQWKKDGSNFDSDNFQFSKDIQCHKGKRIVTVLLVFDRINFFNMMHLHFDVTFNGKLL